MSLPDSIHSFNDRLPIGHSIIELQSVDSTNNYATRMVHEGMASHGMVFFAAEQTAGKGQRGKTWVAAIGQNLTLSIVIKPYPLRIQQQFRLSISIALACQEFFSSISGEAIFIKWPNDIYWNDRKAGGILIENIINGNNWKIAIFGIGLNINQESFGQGLTNAVSLWQITGQKKDLHMMAKTLCEFIEKRLLQLLSGNFREILKQYNRVLYKKNEKVFLEKKGEIISTTIKRVSSTGQLVTLDNVERKFNYGEIKWVISS